MTITHDFKESMERSQAYSSAAWWLTAYREAFPNLESCVEVKNDGWAQRAGIDRVLTLADGKVIKVDEKVREKDYGDILLEYWSDAEKKIAGWVCKPLDCDFIAYAIAPSQTCYLLPTLLLQRAWRQNCRAWGSFSKENKDGFRRVVAKNKGYSTHSLAVPIECVMQAITGAMVVSWKN